MSTVPLFAPDGSLGDIPAANVKDALAQGYKMGVEMVSPDGKTGIIPMDQAGQARSQGFMLTGSRATPQAPQPQMQTNSAGQSYGAASVLGDMGLGAVKGLTSTVTGIPAIIGNEINKRLGYSTPDRVTAQNNYLQPTNTAQKVGKYGEQAAEILVPAVAGISALPTTSKASALFEDVMGAAKGAPVNLTRTQPALERVAQLTDAGGPALSAPNKLLARSQTINPIPYEEARDFYSNISNLSSQDKMALNGPMGKAVGELANSFKLDIGDTAASVGKGEQYAQAMKQYRQAKQLQGAAKTAGKYGVGAAVGGTGAYTLLNAVRDILGK